jgi:hypothetical protein
MRIRATAAVACGVLALSALAVPASQAAQPHKDRPSVQDWAKSLKDRAQSGKRGALSARTATAPVINKVVVNGGKPIVVGATEPRKVTVAITTSDASGIRDASPILYFGKTLETATNYIFQDDGAATCKSAGGITWTCTVNVTVDPSWLLNSQSTTWHVGAVVMDKDLEYTQNKTAATTKLQRLSKVTVNAAPEPVKKGGTLTVTGKLSRANWETHTYKGYAGQAVTLQFRKKTSNVYTNLKTLKTSSTGTLSTTTKSTVDGAYLWNFAGTSTTPAIIAAGDGVDVK